MRSSFEQDSSNNFPQSPQYPQDWPSITAQGRLAEADEVETRSRYSAMLAKVRLARASGNVLRYFE